MPTDLKHPKPGVLRRDLKPCDACGKPLLQQPGHHRTLQAYRVELDMLMLDIQAARQYAGVMAILGGESPFSDNVANVLAPDTELLKCLETIGGIVCQPCYFYRPPIELARALRERRDEAKEKGEA